MGRIGKPFPGKLILSAIFSDQDALDGAIAEMEKKYGRIDFETDIIPFLHTTYYREEMGDDLKRKFFSFEKKTERNKLADIKIFTNKIEGKYGEVVDDFVFRKVNLDPGIISPANLVLASTKDYAHRIYLDKGIYAEVTLLYIKKKFTPLPWTYPDYTEPEILDFFTRVRERLLDKQYGI